MITPEKSKTDSDFGEILEQARGLFATDPSEALRLIQKIQGGEGQLESSLINRANVLELQALLILRKPQDAMARIPNALAIAESGGAPALCPILAMEVNLLITVGDFEAATGPLARVLELSEGLSELEGLRASVLIARGYMQCRQVKFEEALLDYREAAGAFSRLGENANYIQALINTGTLLMNMGDCEGALENYLLARSALDEHSNHRLQNQVAYNVAVLHGLLDQSVLAFAEIQGILGRSSDLADKRPSALALALAAELAVKDGDSELGLRYLQRSEQLCSEFDVTEMDADLFCSLANVYRELGQLEESRRCLEAIGFQGPKGDLRIGLIVEIAVGRLHLAEGKLDGLVAEVHKMEASAVEFGHQDLRMNVLQLGVDVFAACGQFEEALRWSKRHAATQADILQQAGVRNLRMMQADHGRALAKEQQRVAQEIQIGLESVVRERTRELLVANTQLKKAIADREGAFDAQRTLEASLQRAQRLESLGRLSSGLAHDFNNLLTIIMSSAEVLTTTAVTAASENLALEVVHAAKRGAALTAGLLSFGKYEGTSLTVFEPDVCLEEFMHMARRLISDNITIESTLDAKGIYVKADKVHFESIVLNLIINARDAMGDRGQISLISGFDPARNAYTLSVLDQGHGISAGNLERVFDPFFSTKEAGVGTGLGLAMASSLLARFHGSIEVADSSPAGTQMSIRLPVAVAPTKPETVSRKAACVRGSRAESPIAGKRILLVEDDDAVRLVLQRQLELLGVEVFALGSGEAALDHLQGAVPLPNMIVSDVNMPSTGGVELVMQLAKSDCVIPTLLISGMSEPDSTRSPELSAHVHFLMKPFGMGELEAALVQLL